MNENENIKNAIEPTGGPEWPRVTLQRIPFNISRRLSLISLLIIVSLKTDHYVRGWKRYYYEIWSRDVKIEVTIEKFRFEIPRKIPFISGCISEIDIFSEFDKAILRFSTTAKFLKQSLKQIKTLDLESSEPSSIPADHFEPISQNTWNYL